MPHLWCLDTSPLITEKEAVSCIINVARRAEREMLCLHLPVLVFTHSYNLLTVRASVRFLKGLLQIWSHEGLMREGGRARPSPPQRLA